MWEGISIKKGDKITVVAKIGTDGQEYSRARWAGVIFAPITKGKDVLEKSKTLSTQQIVGSAAVVNGQVQADNAAATDKKGLDMLSFVLRFYANF